MTATTEPLLRTSGLGKRFKLYDHPYHRLAEWLLPGGRKRHEEFWALRDIDLELRPGECLGIIGKNGAGKSTLLKLLSGALIPTTGSIDVRGRIHALIELRAGFNPQLTGRQNIWYVGEMLGLDEGYIEAKTPEILAFAELAEHIDRPAKTYSSGMFARLSFSLYAFLDPDVLMIDEVLAVGDSAFKQKCYDHIERLIRDEGRTTIYVSHGLNTVSRLATRVLWLENGVVQAVGEPLETINAYLARAQMPTLAPAAPAAAPETPPRQASGPAGTRSTPPTTKLLFEAPPTADAPGRESSIHSIWVENRRGDSTGLAHAAQPFTLGFALRHGDPATAPTTVHIRVRDASGATIATLDSAEAGVEFAPADQGAVQVVRVPVRRGFATGRYSIEVRIAANACVTAALTVLDSGDSRPFGPFVVEPPQTPPE